MLPLSHRVDSGVQGAPAPTDGYLRILRRPTPSSDDPWGARAWGGTPDGLSFIDVEPSNRPNEPWFDRFADQLRSAPEQSLLQCTAALVRADAPPKPHDLEEAAAQIRQRWGRNIPLGAVHVEPTGAPLVVWHQENRPEEDDAVLLARARAAELNALVEWGDAHWQPRGYHFRLPSGEHRCDFIRLADALRRPRDAEILAWWLLPYFDENTALLIDTGSLLPVVLALRAALLKAEKQLGNVVVRDEYPESRLQDRALVDRAGGDGLVALVSVSSTGETAGSIAEALRDRRAETGWRLETFVSRTEPSAMRYVTASETPAIAEPWLHIASNSNDESECPDCKSPLVRIDPRTFANTILPDPAVVTMPDPPKPFRDLSDLLTMYDDVDGIGLECDHAMSTVVRRGRRRAAIRFYPEKLLSHPSFAKAAATRLLTPGEDWQDGPTAHDLQHLRGFDSILIVEQEDDESGQLRAFCGLLDTMLGVRTGSATIVKVPRVPTQDSDASLRSSLADSRQILIVTLGAVTGGTLQELLVRTHRAKENALRNSYSVSGLAVHARPVTYDEWRSTRSSFHGRLVALWLTYLPWRSVTEEELTLLDWGPGTDDEFNAFRKLRVSVGRHSLGRWDDRVQEFQPSSGEVGNPRAVFLCENQDDPDEAMPRLLPTSRFGHRASMMATLVGIGTIMQRARLDHLNKGAPPWVAFDLTRIPVAYFESPILAAVLRWLAPHEAKWDGPHKNAADVLREMRERVRHDTPGAEVLLVGELLLAATAGKVPRSVFPNLRDWAADVCKSHSNPVSVTSALKLLDIATPS